MSWEKYIRDGIGAVGKADYATAESALKKALHIAKEHYPRGDGRLAVTLSLLGHVYFRNRDFLRAELLLEQSLRLHSQQVDTHFNEPCVLMDLFSLGEIKKAVGKRAEACRLYNDTIKRMRDSGQHKRLVVMQATEAFEQLMNNARSKLSHNELQELEQPSSTPCSTETPVDCLPIQQPRSVQSTSATRAGMNSTPPVSSVPGDHEKSATDKMIEVWHQQLYNGLKALSADDDEREQLVRGYLNCESAFRLVQTLFPEHDVRFVATLKALADASGRLRLFEQAEKLYKQADAIVKESAEYVVSSHHAIRIALGLLYVDDRRFMDAKKLFDEEDVPEELREMPAFVGICKRMDKAQEAIRCYLHARELFSMAQKSEAAGDLEQAGRFTNNAISTLKQSFPPNHPEHAQLLRYRAELHRHLGNLEQANEIERRVERIERANEHEIQQWAHIAEELPVIRVEKV